MAGDPFGMLLRQRIVFLGGEVTDFTADAVISQLLLLDSQDPTKVPAPSVGGRRGRVALPAAFQSSRRGVGSGPGVPRADAAPQPWAATLGSPTRRTSSYS